MKNFTFLISSLFSISAVYAQPIIVANQYNASVGESYSVHTSNYVSPGSGGANSTWDLSTLADNGINVINYTAANPSYSGSNITADYGGGTSINFIFDNFGQHYRAISAGGTVIDYSNPQTLLQFPIAFNSSFTDDFYATFFSGVSFTRFGGSTGTIDGYGTLITPEGTFTNVLRLHLVIDYKDSSSFGNIDYLTDVYAWYKADIHQEIASVSMLTSSLGGTTPSGTYLETSSLGLTEEEKSALRIFPNPANDYAIIDLDLNQNVKSLILNDIQGKSFQVEYTTTDSKIELDTEKLVSGIYFVQIELDNGTIQQGKFIKK